MDTKARATELLRGRWEAICEDCLAVLGSELHYQAMVYDCLRLDPEIPVKQIGMNVKMWLEDPVSEVFRGGSTSRWRLLPGGDDHRFGPREGGAHDDDVPGECSRICQGVRRGVPVRVARTERLRAVVLTVRSVPPVTPEGPSRHRYISSPRRHPEAFCARKPRHHLGPATTSEPSCPHPPLIRTPPSAPWSGTRTCTSARTRSSPASTPTAFTAASRGS